MKILVTGATGLAGSEVVRQALRDPAIDGVTALVRRPLGIEEPKLKSVTHDDFTRYDGLLDGHDAIVWCLGIASNQVTKEAYERITYDYAVAAAKAWAAIEATRPFVFLSGGGADSKEKSFILFARVKGRTENEVMRILPNATCFRPAFIRPVFEREKVPFGRKVIEGMSAVAGLVTKSAIIDADVLAREMLAVAKGTMPPKRVLENSEILALSDRS